MAVESPAPAASVSIAAGMRLQLRPLMSLDEAERARLVAAAAAWGEAHPYQHPGFVLAAGKAGRYPPLTLELCSAAGELCGYWLAYEFDRAAGPLRLSVVWARGLPVVEPELRRDAGVFCRFVQGLLDATDRRDRLAVMVTTEPAADEAVESALQGFGFDRQDLSSIAIDLSKPEDELWSAVSKGTRYSMKTAQRANVTLAESAAPADFEKLAAMVGRTLEAGGVGYHLSIEEFHAYRDLAVAGGGRLTVASVDGELVGATFEVILGDRSITHLWTTNDVGRKLRVGAFMVWETIRRCRADGLRWLDLGTVMTQPEEGSKAAGIHGFKTKWGGSQVATPFYRRSGALDRLIQSLRQWRRGPQG